MKATKSYVEHKFEEFNKMCFDGKLQKIPVELSDAKTFLGICVFKKRKTQNGETEYYDFRLRINTRIDLPEEIVEDTILHEMIHYFIGVNHLKDTSAHGPLFQHIMNSINERFNRHVTISHRGTLEQNEDAIDKRALYHVVAVVSLNNGRMGIKILPRILPRILYYYNMILAQDGVKSIKLFMSNDPYFNQYPNSSSLKVYFIDEELLREHLVHAEFMDCNGKMIIRNKKK
jgi:predicted SprT family Zn-dependent metalloprotease